MKSYSVWSRDREPAATGGKEEPPVLIPQHFQWSAFFFGGIGLFCAGARVAGGLAFALTVLCGVLLAGSWAFPAVMVGGRLALAAFGPEIREWDLRLHGYRQTGVAVGPNRDAALLRYLDGAGSVTTPQASTVIPDPFAAISARG